MKCIISFERKNAWKLETFEFIRMRKLQCHSDDVSRETRQSKVSGSAPCHRQYAPPSTYSSFLEKCVLAMRCAPHFSN